MKFTLLAVLAFYVVLCSSQPAPRYDLSDYFYAKHVIDDDIVQRQLLSNIPDSTKLQILQDYVGLPFWAKPNPNKPAETKPWRAALGAKSGTTFILASPQEISSAVKDGVLDGKDSKGLDVFKTKITFSMIKAKINFVEDGSGSGPKKNIIVSFVEDGKPTIREEFLRVSYLGGKINHFESDNKIG